MTNVTPRPFTLEPTKNGWQKGTSADGSLTFMVRAFEDPSSYGIKNGRISKLQIVHTAKIPTHGWNPAHSVVNYDRGWDVRPTGKEAKALLAAIIAELN